MKKELSSRLKQVPNFPESQYFREVFTKRQIVLHHTVSGPGEQGDINWWRQTHEKVATCVIVDRDGTIHQLFPSKYWAHHLGIKAKNNTALNRQSIGIELDSWGQLTEKLDENGENPKYYSFTGKEVPAEQVQIYDKPFRGSRFYEKYTPEQIESVKLLLEFWGETYKIPLTYKLSMWEKNDEALGAVAGVWGHTAYRQDKSDPHPQPELIEMLKGLI